MTKAARRKVLLKNLVKAREALKAKHKHSLGGTDVGKVHFHAASWVLGKVETLIEFYAASQGISPAPIAAELGKLLRHRESGPKVGAGE